MEVLTAIFAILAREIASAFFAECLTRIDVIAAAFRRANTSTATESKPDPKLEAAIHDALTQAVRSGDLPPGVPPPAGR